MVFSGVMAAASVAGSFTAATPSLSTSAADTNYAKLLQYSLYFYDANMCGENSATGLSWRGDCHTQDEVKGGFHDAGDHAMFGLPQGYSAATLGWGYYEFKDAYDATGQGAHLKVITDDFCDFFRRSAKMNGNTITSFLYQKGDGNMDHNYWGPPEQQDASSRRMFWASGFGGDIAGEYAAALALNYLNFGNPDDLTYAKAYYDFASRNTAVATEGCSEFYKSSSSQDERAWAAGWLYLATKDEKYKNDCLSLQNPYPGWVHEWNTVDIGAASVAAHITGDWSKVNSYLGKECNGTNYKFILKWGSARYNANLQLCALVASKNSSADYTSWAKTQMEYITGDRAFANGQTHCLVVGFKPNASKNPHHRAASGTNSAAQENDGTPTKYSLIGALCGGPVDESGTYTDVRSDYVGNEVAVDYNAGFVGAAAGLYSVFKGGSIDTSIEGVTKIYGGSNPQPQETTTQPQQTTAPPQTQQPQQTTTTPQQGGDIVLTPADMSVGTEKGDDGETNNFAEFAPQGAKSATLYYKINSNDMNTSGAFGTWNGEWMQEDFTNIKVPADKIVAVDYVIPANVGQTVKAMVFWPHGDAVTIEKVVLHKDASTPTTTTTKDTPTTTTVPTTTTTAPPATTQPQNPDLHTLWGDANCDQRVTVADAVAILQSIGNKDKYRLSATGMANADVDGIEGVTPNDALVIQQVDAGIYSQSQLPLMWGKS